MPQKIVPATRKEVLDGVKKLRDGFTSQPSERVTKALSASSKHYFFHLQTHRQGDKDLAAVDTYVAARKAAFRRYPAQRAQYEEDLAAYELRAAREIEDRKKDPNLPDQRLVKPTAPDEPEQVLTADNHWPSNERLGKVGDDDHLYLVAHGMLGGPKIGNWGRLGDQYTPEQIAARLEGRGLAKTHRVFKLFACWGAVQVEPREEDLAQVDDRPFAEKLAEALHRRGYESALVLGYGGTVSTPTKIRDNSSEEKKYVGFAENLADYDDLKDKATDFAKAHELEAITTPDELGYLRHQPLDKYASAYGLDPDDEASATVRKLDGWDYRGVYITDTRGAPWVLVIPYPPTALEDDA